MSGKGFLSLVVVSSNACCEKTEHWFNPLTMLTRTHSTPYLGNCRPHVVVIKVRVRSRHAKDGGYVRFRRKETFASLRAYDQVAANAYILTSEKCIQTTPPPGVSGIRPNRQ